MTDAFRITVHWAEGIIELRCPSAPTLVAFQRASSEIRATVARMTGPWKVLVDDTAVESVPEGLLEAIRDIVLWAIAHGMVKSARVTRAGSEFDKLLRALGPETDLPRASGQPCASREEAWKALTDSSPRTTPVDTKAVAAAGTLRR